MVPLMKTPHKLNTRQIIADGSLFLMPGLGKNKHNTYKSNNHAFSFWLYMNENNTERVVTETDSASTTSLKEYTIFYYGSSHGGQKGGRPQIVYINDGEKKIDTYRVYISDNTDCTHETTDCFIEFNAVPLQRWNFFVINFNQGGLDIFVNGELKQTSHNKTTYKPSQIPRKDDIVYVGETDGLDGVISDAIYHKNDLSIFEITNMYNLYQGSIPTFSTSK